ncbi:MAG TPA: penicillin-binding transpeptidase domain-containing protein [bacterium]|jgi:cell division protein FtsI (penicillin-binding protein 3)|nr:penicillin-binding transpeptidase domain-containing protein [bacterium]
MPAPDPQSTQRRIGRLAAFMAALFALVVARLVYLQIIRRPFLLEKSDRQQFARVDVPGRRGVITDRYGQVLAESVDTESVFCSPSLVKPGQRAGLAHVLASVLGLNESGVRRQLDAMRPFWVVRNAKIEATARLKELKINSLSYEAETRRVYPEGRLAAHVLGYTDVDCRGLDGVELSYNSVLEGKPGVQEVLRDAAGRQVAGQQLWVQRPVDGSGLRLTLDSDLQHIAERELQKAWQKFHAKGGAIVVMDPRTGEILAMASAPDFDPSHPGAFGQDARWNRALGDAFEPGSTFKVVTAALALEKGVVTPNTPVDCHGGSAVFFGRTVRDYGQDHMGIVPFSTVLADSSNIGTVEVALKIGPQALYEGMTRFGFGQLSGVDLPGETIGQLQPQSKWQPSAMAAVPFGQSFSCNLLRVLVTYAAVANGGNLVRPHVVQAVVGDSGSVMAPERNFNSTRVIGETVRGQLVKILEGVVDRGTGVAIALPGYSIAGKTGTAQKFDLATGRYSKTASVSTFVGFVPAENPVFVTAVMLDEPRGLDLGGWTSGPVFRSVMSAALTDYNVPPDDKISAEQDASGRAAEHKGDWTGMYKRGVQAEAVAEVDVPDLRGLTAANARLKLARLGLRMRLLGKAQAKARISGQFPKEGSSVLQNSTVTLALQAQDGAGAGGSKDSNLLARLLGRQ